MTCGVALSAACTGVEIALEFRAGKDREHMNAKDYADQLLQILKQAKAAGTESIPTDALTTYIKKTAEGADGPAADYAVNMETYKANLQGNIEAYKLAQAHKLEMFRATNTAGQNALRT
jgi:hypothetical protein